MTDLAGMGEPTRCPQCDRRLKPDETCPICPDNDDEPEMSREQAYQAFRDHQDKYEGDSDVYDPLQQVYADACRAGELAAALKVLKDALPEPLPPTQKRVGNFQWWCSHCHHRMGGDTPESIPHRPNCYVAARNRALAALAAWQGAQ